jgi:uridylate kinase
MNKKIVIKIGGSLLFDKDKNINYNRISAISDIILNTKFFDSVIIVCGGGILAREYINIVRKFSKNETLCDLVGIDVSRLNARLFMSYFGPSAYPLIPKTIEEVSLASKSYKIVVIGGLLPGQSTTTVAIELAEFLNAQYAVILTDVQGIFDKDPKVDKSAKLIKEVTLKQLQQIILNNSKQDQAAAGEYRIFDAVSLQILKRSKIPVYIISGLKLDAFTDLMNGSEEIKGTLIVD